MGYASAFISKYGQACTIARTPSVASKVLEERTRRSGDPSKRDGEWRGTILADSALASGEMFTVGDDTYLVESVTALGDYLEWYAVKCNADVVLWRLARSWNANGDEIQTWTQLASTKAWGQIVTAHLRTSDPGLLDSARYIFDLPKSLGVQTLDRIVYGERNFQVESIDDVAMAGVVRVQLGEDNRGG